MNKKSLIALVSTFVLLGGLLGTYTLIQEGNIFSSNAESRQLMNPEEVLEHKINEFSNDAFKPEMHAILLAEISSFHNQGNIRTSTKERLTELLDMGYKKQVYKQCESYLKIGDNTYSTYLGYLTDLKKVFGEDSKSDYYANQINKQYYYNVSLPNKVNLFLNRSVEEFSNSTYQSYKRELQNTPGLDGQYKLGSISSKNTSLIQRLDDFEQEHQNYLARKAIEEAMSGL